MFGIPIVQLRLLEKGVSIGTLLLVAVFLMGFYVYLELIDHEIVHPYKGLSNSGASTLAQNTPQKVSLSSCERNMSAASIQSFSSLPEHMQDFLYYQHCRHFPLLLDLPNKCGGADQSSEVFLLLVIKSGPENHERREMLRKTWAKERIQSGVWIRLIFLIGTTGSGFERKRLNKVVELEHSQYKDILQWDFTDTFCNLTLKQVIFLEWFERNCPKARFLLDGDDDVFVNTNNVVKYLQSLKDNDGSKHLFAGCQVWTGPVRDSGNKYFVPVQLYESNEYPPYCSGGGFIMSGYTASVIYNMSKSIPLIPIDDAYMGMCLNKAGLSPSLHGGVKTFGVHFRSEHVDDYDPCFYKELLLVHRFLSEKIYFMWHSVNDPNLKCFGNDKK
ncbi:N-acetyllactosaminide beta-1%2C3-N-acetylglucosaminyltransferase 3-like isoform X3 [Xyrichtys novacula]|uniref:Hexosyltransferase n=1 Tax=Xyrichtys novacula TaxID=13765 RepID=A0AAV1FU96_XYRNO|nr:N-acetyllactosaminide beta-1%2C3-N-acetylglucosaminyltransferase 3-like isoform X3 [Xyrichtys novacula]